MLVPADATHEEIEALRLGLTVQLNRMMKEADQYFTTKSSWQAVPWTCLRAGEAASQAWKERKFFMNQKTFSIIAGVIFLLIAITHVLKLVLGWDVKIQGASLPNLFSYVAIVIFGMLGCAGFCCCKGDKKS